MERTMIATAKRHKNDAYYTSASLTKVLTNNVKLSTGGIFEPCAGKRHISDELAKQGYIVTSTDLEDAGNHPYGGQPVDATTREFWEWWSADNEIAWTVTNPPFNAAPDILPHALEYSSIGIAMLLRVTYIEPCKNRAQWLIENADQMTHVIPVNPRPKFRADRKGTDSATLAWFVWDKRHSWKRLGVQCPFVFAAGWNKE